MVSSSSSSSNDKDKDRDRDRDRDKDKDEDKDRDDDDTGSGNGTTVRFMPPSFPLGSRVILKDLVKAPHFNGTRGTVQSILSGGGRHRVLVESYDHDDAKPMSLKPSNLEYETRSIDSLSVRELKSILLHDPTSTSKSSTSSSTSSEWVGLDKSNLQSMVMEVCHHDDQRVAHALATIAAANNNSNNNSNRNNNSNNNNNSNSNNTDATNQDFLRNSAERMSRMTPEQLRSQVSMLRSMDKDALRRTNPLMSSWDDRQIDMAIRQMETMANDPAMLRMASEQMKRMSPEDLRRHATTNATTNATTASSSSSSSVPSTDMSTTTTLPTTMTATAAEAAAEQMSSMTPEQLKRQASMMRGMDRGVLRSMAPQMSHLTDTQIDAAIGQMEYMSSHPEMMRMATEHIRRNAEAAAARTESTTESTTEPTTMGSPPRASTSGGTALTRNDARAIATDDPAQILKNMTAAEFRGMISMMKDNPEMMKQLGPLLGQNGGSAGSGNNHHHHHDDDHHDDVERIRRMMEQLDRMDDAQLERTMKMMGAVHGWTRPLTDAYRKIDERIFRGRLRQQLSSLSLSSLLSLLFILAILAVLVLVFVTRQFRTMSSKSSSSIHDIDDVDAHYDEPNDDESEF